MLCKKIDKDYDIDLLEQVISYNHDKYYAYREGLYFEPNKDFERILKARYQKCSRIKRRFIYLLTRSDYVWFCTFTFDNYYIKRTDRTKRDLIKSVIDTHDFKFMLNIDYGKTTEREHYHCIIGTSIDMDVNQFIQEKYPCHCLAIQCKKGREDFKRLSKYINKLTNHCIKATTKRQRMLYNFKGYDLFDTKEGTFFYHLDMELLFSVKEDFSSDVGLT